MQLGTTFIDQNRANVGESRTADQIIDRAGFAIDADGETIEEQSEMVLLQSTTLTVDDPAFRAAMEDTVATLSTFDDVTKLDSPLGDHAGLVSTDGHSALVQFVPGLGVSGVSSCPIGSRGRRC